MCCRHCLSTINCNSKKKKKKDVVLVGVDVGLQGISGGIEEGSEEEDVHLIIIIQETKEDRSW
jgi:hypothetical protein